MKKYVEVPLYIGGGIENEIEEIKVMNIIVEVRIFVGSLSDVIKNKIVSGSAEPICIAREIATGYNIPNLSKNSELRDIIKYGEYNILPQSVSKRYLYVKTEELRSKSQVNETEVKEYLNKFNKEKLYDTIKSINEYNQKHAGHIKNVLKQERIQQRQEKKNAKKGEKEYKMRLRQEHAVQQAEKQKIKRLIRTKNKWR